MAPPGKRNPWDGPPQTFTYWLAPAPLLRKSFAVTKPVRRATVFGTALGVYELQLNGARVGRDYLHAGLDGFPGAGPIPDLRRHCAGAPGRQRARRDPRRRLVCERAGLHRPALLSMADIRGCRVQLEIEYADGTREIIASDGTWRAAMGAVRHADLMHGLRIRCAAVSTTAGRAAGFDDSALAAGGDRVARRDPQQPPAKFVLEAANAEPTRIDGELPARTRDRTAAGVRTRLTSARTWWAGCG